MFIKTDTILALRYGPMLDRTVLPTALDRLGVAVLVSVQGALDPECKTGTGGREAVAVLTTDEVLYLVRGIDLAVYPVTLIRILKDMPSTHTNPPVAILYWKGLVPVMNHRREYRSRHRWLHRRPLGYIDSLLDTGLLVLIANRTLSLYRLLRREINRTSNWDTGVIRRSVATNGLLGQVVLNVRTSRPSQLFVLPSKLLRKRLARLRSRVAVILKFISRALRIVTRRGDLRARNRTEVAWSDVGARRDVSRRVVLQRQGPTNSGFVALKKHVFWHHSGIGFAVVDVR
jgi:hypothetical protein